MDKTAKLRLIQKKKDTASTFGNSCPLRFSNLPTKPCSMVDPADGPPRCPWYIKSEKHHFCFWNYIKDNSNLNGEMLEKTPREAAKLVGMTVAEFNKALEGALEELKYVVRNDPVSDFWTDDQESLSFPGFTDFPNRDDEV